MKQRTYKVSIDVIHGEIWFTLRELIGVHWVIMREEHVRTIE